MNFGEAWKASLGECSKSTAFSILDYFYSQGGNFIDTAVNYQDGESEQWIGEWMESRGNRDEMVVATKFTGAQRASEKNILQSNFGGNSAKNIFTSVERSLSQLKSSYIDIVSRIRHPLSTISLETKYYLHVYDNAASIPEVMHALNDLVTSRRVIYLGISDTPAWIVAKMNAYARRYGLRQFNIYQGQWSAACRDFEREIIPCCVDEGMALAPWGALGSGMFRKPASDDDSRGRKSTISRTGKEERVSKVLDEIATVKDTLITSVALAYVMHKAPHVFPILGGRKVEHLASNIAALSLVLSEEEMQKIDAAYGFEMGFPHSFVNPNNRTVLGPRDNMFNQSWGTFDFVEGPKAIRPHQGPTDEKLHF